MRLLQAIVIFGAVASATAQALEHLMGGVVRDGAELYAAGFRVSVGPVAQDSHHEKCDAKKRDLLACLFDESELCECEEYFDATRDCAVLGSRWGEFVDAVAWMCSPCFSALWHLAETWQCWDPVDDDTLDQAEACGDVCRPLICDTLAVCPEGGMANPNMTEYHEMRRMLLEATRECACFDSPEAALARLQAVHLDPKTSRAKPVLRITPDPTSAALPSTTDCVYHVLTLASSPSCVKQNSQDLAVPCDGECHVLKCSTLAACPAGQPPAGVDRSRYEKFRAKIAVDSARCPCSK